MMFQGPGVQVVAQVPVAEPVPPPISVVMPRGDGHLDLLRADEVDVGVDAAGRADLALAGDDLGARPDHQPRVDAATGSADCRTCRRPRSGPPGCRCRP